MESMRRANRLVGLTLAEIGRIVVPGVSTSSLDWVAETFIRDNGAIPSFKNFPNPFGSHSLHPFVLLLMKWWLMAYPMTKRSYVVEI